MFGDYRRQVEAYIEELITILKTACASVSCMSYVGNFEKNLEQYHRTYEQANWCLENVPCPDGGVAFFMDHVETYLLSRIPSIELVNIFACSQKLLVKSDKDSNLLSTIKVVYDSGMNLQKAAAVLGVHRNTIYQRVKRLEDMLGLNPIENEAAIKFLYYLTRSNSADGK